MGALGWDVYKESMLMNSGYLDDVAKAFREAADAFAQIVDRPEVAEGWERASALEGYTVGGVVGHVNAAIGWLGPLLDAPPPLDLRPAPEGLLRFVNGLKIDPGGVSRHAVHDVIRDQCEKAARHGWESNRDKFRSLAARLADRLEGEAADRVLDLRPTAPLTARLGDFLRTRVLELVVHTDDLATSVGIVTPAIPEGAATVAIDVMTAIARAAHGDVAVIRALARRERASAAVFPVF